MSVGITTLLIAGLLFAIGIFSDSQFSQPAQIDAAAISRTPVSIDALPTVQINGVIWSQAVSGNIVYAGGLFTSARPAGSAAGQNETRRNSLVAFDIATGQMTSFDGNLNGNVRTVAVAPNGIIYVGGDFTSAKGVSRSRIAAYNPNGSLISTFAPVMNDTVRAIVATNDTIYVGGSFTTANGVTRNRLAAFNSTGGLLGTWSPSANDQVTAMVMAPDASRLVVGGRFTTLAGSAAYGLGAVSVGGAALPFAANSVIRDAGPGGAITSLSTDGTSIFGSGYDFGASANFEGVFRASPKDGEITWMEDCHGDSYGAFAQAGAVYTVSHAHDCSTINGFPQKVFWHRALAFTLDPTQQLLHNRVANYSDFFGQPAPSLLSWYPLMDAGTFTGQNQAAWTITGTDQYLSLGGEFPTVNGKGQQGLVRFALRTVPGNPNDHGPELGSAALKPTLTTPSPGTVRVSFPTNWDRDDQTLNYRVVRDGNLASPIFTVDAASTFWNLPSVTYDDVEVPAGTHSYRIYGSDPSGNTANSDVASITVVGGGNVAPTAAFTSSSSGLDAAFNASGSTDPDGTVTAYSWTFGDGTTGSGVSPNHPFSSAGTYLVTLTVTDNNGATGVISRNVSVAQQTGALAADSFTRTVPSGFGAADIGGNWTATGSALSVSGGAGRMSLAAGSGPSSTLASVNALNVNEVIDISANKRPAGANAYFSLDARKIGTSTYRTKLALGTGGGVIISLVRVVNGAETTLASASPAGSYTAGSTMKLRLSLVGSSPTVLSAKVWNGSASEPASWTVTSSDTTAVLQASGGVGIVGYLSTAASNAPVELSVDNLSVAAG